MQANENLQTGFRNIQEKLPLIQKRLRRDHKDAKSYLGRLLRAGQPFPLSEEQQLRHQASFLQALAVNGVWHYLKPENFKLLDPILVVLTRTQVLKGMEDRLRDQRDTSIYSNAKSGLDKLFAVVSLERANSVGMVSTTVDDATMQSIISSSDSQNYFSDSDKVIGMGLSSRVKKIPGFQTLLTSEQLTFELLTMGNKIRNLETILDPLATSFNLSLPEISKTTNEARRKLKQQIDKLKQEHARRALILAEFLEHESTSSDTISTDEQS